MSQLTTTWNFCLVMPITFIMVIDDLRSVSYVVRKRLHVFFWVLAICENQLSIRIQTLFIVLIYSRHSKRCKLTRDSTGAVCGHLQNQCTMYNKKWRLPKADDFHLIRKGICDFLLVINSNLALSLTVSEIWTIFPWKTHIFTLSQARIWKLFLCTASLMQRASTVKLSLSLTHQASATSFTWWGPIHRRMDGQADGRQSCHKRAIQHSSMASTSSKSSA